MVTVNVDFPGDPPLNLRGTPSWVAVSAGVATVESPLLLGHEPLVILAERLEKLSEDLHRSESITSSTSTVNPC